MIKTSGGVLSKLARLNDQFAKTGERRLALFNRAYYIVTTNIRDAVTQNYFKNPQLIEAFSICFAQYYFDAVDDFYCQPAKLPLAWARMADISRLTPQFITLLMGANAHINQDLPLALSQTLNGRPTDDLLEDITRIDRLLKLSGRQILQEFNELNCRLDFVKRHGQLVYFYPIMHLIFWWRIRAWRNYQRLKKGRVCRQYSLGVANYLLGLGHWLSKV